MIAFVLNKTYRVRYVTTALSFLLCNNTHSPLTININFSFRWYMHFNSCFSVWGGGRGGGWMCTKIKWLFPPPTPPGPAVYPTDEIFLRLPVKKEKKIHRERWPKMTTYALLYTWYSLRGVFELFLRSRTDAEWLTLKKQRWQGPDD